MKDKTLNVANYLADHALQHGDDIAIQVPHHGVSISFKALHEKSNALAAYFRKRGITPKMRVLLMLRPSADLIATAFALLKLGAVPVIIDPGMGLKPFLKAVKTIKPEAIIGIRLATTLSRIFHNTFYHTRIRITLKPPHTLQEIQALKEFDIEATTKESLSAILFTSGSTGAPKGVEYTHGIFSAQIDTIREVYNITPGEVDMPMLPIFALFNPALGMQTVIPDINPSRPATANPKLLVDTITRFNVTNSFGSPVLWTKITDYCEAHKKTLPSLKRVLMAGCAVPESLVQRFQALIPNGTVHAPYGATEVLPVSNLSSKDSFQNTEPCSCLSQPLSINDVRIIENTEANSPKLDPLPPRVVGEIAVSGPLTTKAYANAPRQTAAAKIHENAKVWHRMGDLGYFDESGNLYFCGRKAEAVHANGNTYYTDPLERVMNDHPKVSRSALIELNVKGATIPAMAIEPYSKHFPYNKKAKRELHDELREYAKRHEVTRDIDHFYFKAAFPVDVRHNAKINRKALGRHFQP